MWVFNCLGRVGRLGWFGQYWNCPPNWQQFPQQRTTFYLNFQQDTQIRKSWGHPFKNQKSMLIQVNDCKNSWLWIIKHVFLINERTFLNILDTLLCKIMNWKMKCIFELCAAIWQDFGHPKNMPSISLSHTIECMWERRTSLFPVLDTNLCNKPILLNNSYENMEHFKS